MSLIDALVSGASGGVLGSLLHMGSSWVETNNNIKLMNAQVAAAEKTEAWKAFAASQGGSESLAIPSNAPAWAVSLYLCVDAIKQLTRPFLTWAAVGIIGWVYYNATPTAREGMSDQIIFGSFTAVFWWFGARYSKSK